MKFIRAALLISSIAIYFATPSWLLGDAGRSIDKCMIGIAIFAFVIYAKVEKKTWRVFLSNLILINTFVYFIATVTYSPADCLDEFAMVRIKQILSMPPLISPEIGKAVEIANLLQAFAGLLAFLILLIHSIVLTIRRFFQTKSILDPKT